MNKELDILLCKIDGKITVYRMYNTQDTYINEKLMKIQRDIQHLWDMNKNVKGKIKELL